MKKKNYQKPTMQVVEIQQCAMLSASESQQGSGEKFTWDGDEEIIP